VITFNQAVGGHSGLEKGLMNGDVNFSLSTDTFDSFRAKGTFVLKDADMMNVPILSQLVKMTGVTEIQGLSSSDAAAALSMAGPVITIERGDLANPISALEAMKDGTINLKTHELDFHVVGVPLKHLSPLLNLPVISLFSNLEKKLTCLHVVGNWSEPASALVKAEPLANIGAGTLGFFKSAAEGGGKLGADIIKGVTGIFSPRRKPASTPEK
jgi:hypothetical protein